MSLTYILWWRSVLQQEMDRRGEPITSLLGKPLSWYGVLSLEDDEMNQLEQMLRQDILIR